MASSADHLKAVNGFLAKAGGKDKLTALIQYTCMFISAGEPGNAKKIQASVAAARKVFRILGPLESVSPIILNPHLNPKKPVPIELLNKLKGVLMAIYFGADHVVWAGQAGLVSNKQTLERYQKASLYGWAGGSLCTVIAEAWELTVLNQTVRRKDESEEAWQARQLKAIADINSHSLVLFHALVQGALATGLLGLTSWKPRFVGFLGVVASAINCYMLFPALPKLAEKPARKEVQLESLKPATLKLA
ncbi:g10509 [Coccomyxa viridis]|uniref:G10509 protein n=1 Tax=Coccomyxa viridis TaxID=1274662 RepID=A0ABP1G876_9CHLO